MFQGRVGVALSLLSGKEMGGVLCVDDEINGKSVKAILREKYPESQAVSVEAVSDSVSLQSYSVLFDSLELMLLLFEEPSLASSGAADPSRLDAYSWRRICSAFGKILDDICHFIACKAIDICV